MARQKANWLVGDLRRELGRVQTALEHLGAITIHQGDPYTSQALGDLSKARDMLQAAVAKFERQGRDYDFRQGDPDGVKFREHVARANRYWDRRNQDQAAGGQS